ncbi:unnamed protein product [Parnassius mnemosyne]|uniref:Uncharacterized protein n=1 Tax=Parnassius mnemosyne TaxID=213953 RepID=A0AAV1M8P5_9NEOP
MYYFNVISAGAGPNRAGPNKSTNVNGSFSPHNSREGDKRSDGNEPEPAPMVVHNISISVTDTDSPAGVRRRVHLRSLSDVTPAARAPVQRARSHSERPRASPAPSPARSLALSPAPSPLRAAVTRSERSSPDASLRESRPVGSGGDPWRKMSEVDLKSAGRARADPWVKSASLRPGEAARRRARGRLERAAPVCEACGRSACDCWRARCTCSPRAARLAPRPPHPAHPARAHSDDETRPRRLYKSASQAICSSTEERPKPADPLLETTC